MNGEATDETTSGNFIVRKAGTLLGLIGTVFTITDLQAMLAVVFVVCGIVGAVLDIVIKWRRIEERNPRK